MNAGNNRNVDILYQNGILAGIDSRQDFEKHEKIITYLFFFL